MTKIEFDKLVTEAVKLINDPRIGSVSQIEVPIQNVSEYELKLVLSLKQKK